MLTTVLEHLIVLTAVATVVVSAARQRQRLHAWVDAPTGAWVIVLAATATHALLALLDVPNAPWQSNTHGIQRAAELYALGLADLPTIVIPFHGTAGRDLFVLLGPLLGGPFHVNVLLSSLGVVSVFALARGLRLSVEASLVAAVAYALMPLRLRVAPTLSLYPGATLGLTTALALLAYHLHDRRTDSLMLAVAVAVWTGHTHADLLALTPLAMVALVMALRPAWLRELPGRRGWMLALLAGAAAMGPHLFLLATFPDALAETNAFQDLRPQTLGSLATLAAVAAALAVARRWAHLLDLRVVAGAGALAGLGASLRLVASPYLARPLPYFGSDPWWANEFVYARPHAFLDPDLTPLLLTTWAVAGLAAGTLVRARATAFLLVTSALCVGLYVGLVDHASSYVRTAGPGIAVGTVALALGVDVWLTAVHAVAPRARAAAASLLALLVAVAVVPYRPGWSHLYPSQQHYHQLVAARDAVAEGRVVHHLRVSDVAAETGDRFDARYFLAHAETTVGAGGRDLTSLLSTSPDHAVGRMVLLDVTCHRAIYPLGRQEDHGPIHVAGRAWHTFNFDEPDNGLLPERLWPCWHHPERATCHEQAPDGDCRTWACPATEAPPRPLPPITDPRCAEVRARFALEPVTVAPLAHGNLSLDLFRALAPGTEVGLYRITGVR